MNYEKITTTCRISYLKRLCRRNKICRSFRFIGFCIEGKELGLITKPEVDALEEKAKSLFNAGDCKGAIPVLIDYSKKSNWLANMIQASLDPYYGASYDDRKGYSYAKLKPLIPLETMANDYKKKRNIAFAMQGECLIKVGDEKGAIPLLLKALDLINMDNDVWWERTRNNLLKVIKVEVK